jgi:hypothetical protein
VINWRSVLSKFLVATVPYALIVSIVQLNRTSSARSDDSLGHTDLPDGECPICTHSPFTASLCLPAKGLQATVKAFIKTEAKKRATEAATPAKPPVEAPAEEPVKSIEDAGDADTVASLHRTQSEPSKPAEQGVEETVDEAPISATAPPDNGPVG